MSRIGKKPILIPKEVGVKIENQRVIIDGPKAKISQEIPEEILVKKEDDKIIVLVKKISKKSSALWGLARALLQNHIIGVTSGFEKKLEIQGVGYRAALESERVIKLELGFSHSVRMEIPAGINVSIVKETLIIISGFDKQKVGEFAAKIKKLKPVEPYKGKGIRYFGEKVRRKAGKKAATVK